jgi:prepilin peptidase CpaA
MIAQILLMIVLPAFLAVAAACDVASFTIPNRLTFVLAAIFPVFGLAVGFVPAVFAFHLAAGLVALVAGFTLFSFGLIGGGDAKLFAAVALWLGWHDLLAYAVAASLLGGLLTMSLLGLRQLPLPAGFMRWDWIHKLHEKNSGIPYGVALAAGALMILPHAEILRLAASS